MKKLSVKILLALALAFFIVTLIPRIVFMFYNFFPLQEIFDSPVFIWGMFITAALALLLFALLMNLIIVRRVKKLSAAMTKVSNGDYYVQLPVTGKDELASLTKNFNTMASELQGNEYLNKEFIRDFSHEFKTPVSAIKGYADLIAEGNLSKEETEEYSKIIASESARLANLSKTMLQLSYLDSKAIIKYEDAFNMAEQIRSVIQMMQLQWEAKGIEFNLFLEDIHLLSNKEFTYQIWLNLIDNAIRYTPENGKIDILLQKRQKLVHFEITDYGSGIADKDKPNIFHLFFVEEKMRNKKSSGVGLAIAKKITDKMNGSISFESIENKHTTFMVDLPYIESELK